MFDALGQTQHYPFIPAIDILRYQLQKTKYAPSASPFKRYGLKRIRAAKYLEDNDPRQIWGWRLHANEEYNVTEEPLYRLFKRNDLSSLGIIDTQGGKIEVVFWDKLYYRRFVEELKHIGFVMQQNNPETNILQMRKTDSSLQVDFTIWPNLYIMSVY